MSKLGNVRRGRQPCALRYLFYGVEGVGKSSLAVDAPNPIYFDLEDGTAYLDCTRYPFEEGTYGEVVGAVDELLGEEHDFQSLVIDTVDRLEPMLWAYICERDSNSRKNLTSIESYGYGKGYQVALDEWRSFACRLDALRKRRRMHVILLGHSHIRPFRNPEGDDFDRYTLKIHEKASGFLREWVDVCGFCAFEGGAAKGLEGGEASKKGEIKERARGYATGRRLAHFDRTAAFDAKRRISIPNPIELTEQNPWAPIAEAMELIQSPHDLNQLIDAELERIGDEKLTATVHEYRTERSDTESLIQILNKLRSK